METTSHYVRVGLFVIILTACLIISLIWLSFGLSGKSYNHYLVYVNESVSGLSLQSAVKYSGVDVGFVSKVQLYKNNPQTVQVTLEIENDVPIYNGTVAILQTQGITGVAYLELKGGEKSEGLLKAPPGQTYPVIKSSHSLLFRLGNAVDHLTKNIEKITRGLDSILNNQNAEAIETTLANFSAMSTDFRANTAKINRIVTDAETTLKNTASASQQLPNVMSSVSASARSIENAAQSLARTSNQAHIVVSNSAVTMETVNNQLMPQAVSAMQLVQTLLSNLENVSQQMEQNPAVIIRGRTPATPGPGE